MKPKRRPIEWSSLLILAVLIVFAGIGGLKMREDVTQRSSAGLPYQATLGDVLAFCGIAVSEIEAIEHRSHLTEGLEVLETARHADFFATPVLAQVLNSASFGPTAVSHGVYFLHSVAETARLPFFGNPETGEVWVVVFPIAESQDACGTFEVGRAG